MFERGLQSYDPRDPLSQGGEPPMIVGPYDELLAAADDVGEGRYECVEGSSSQADVDSVIMIQWCIGHLSDPQFVAFLKKCRAALRPDDPAQPDRRSLIGPSLIGVHRADDAVVKENCANDADAFDEADSSTTRCAARRSGRSDAPSDVTRRFGPALRRPA